MAEMKFDGAGLADAQEALEQIRKHITYGAGSDYDRNTKAIAEFLMVAGVRIGDMEAAQASASGGTS